MHRHGGVAHELHEADLVEHGFLGLGVQCGLDGAEVPDDDRVPHGPADLDPGIEEHVVDKGDVWLNGGLEPGQHVGDRSVVRERVPEHLYERKEAFAEVFGMSGGLCHV